MALISSTWHTEWGQEASQRVTGKCSRGFGLASWENAAGVAVKAHLNSKPLKIQVGLLGVYSTLSKWASSVFMNPNN